MTLANGGKAKQAATGSLLRRFRFGPRLLTLATIPMLALGLMTALQGRDGLAERSELNRFVGQIDEVIEVSDLIQILQHERAISVSSSLADPDAPRTSTLPDLLASIEQGSLGQSILAGIESDVMRAQEIAQAPGVARPDLSYTDIIAETLDALRSITIEAPEPVVGREIDAAVSLHAAVEAIKLQQLEVDIGEGRGQRTQSRALRTREISALRDFGREAQGPPLAALIDRQRDSRWAASIAAHDALVEPLPGSTFHIDDWTDGLEYRLDSMMAVLPLQLAQVQETASSRQAALRNRLAAVALIATGAFVAAGVATLFLRRSVTRPVAGLIEATTELSGGRIMRMKADAKDELGDVERAFNQLDETVTTLLQGVMGVSDAIERGHFGQRVDTSQLPGVWGDIGDTVNRGVQALHETTKREAEANERVAFASSHDLATGLPGPERLAEMVGETSGTPPQSGLTYMVLQPANLAQLRVGGADILRNSLTAFSGRMVGGMPKGALIARLSSTEFIVVHRESSDELSQRALAAFVDPLRLGSEEVLVTPALGLAESNGELDHVSLVSRAVIASDIATGRPELEPVWYHPSMREAVVHRGQLRDWLIESIADTSIVPWFQPIIDIASGEVIGYEALARGWMDGKPVRPDEFIAVAESEGLIADLGKVIFRGVMDSYRRLPGSNVTVAVNFSVSQFRDPNLVQWLTDEVRRAGIPADRVIVEITESDVVADDEDIISRLHQLRGLGMQVAVDDFGTGYSSLSYLSRLPLGVLKIDRSLITPIATSPAAAAVVSRTIELAHDLNLRVVAEGVEEQAELDVLVSLGCDCVQGYFTGRPAAIADLESMSESPGVRR